MGKVKHVPNDELMDILLEEDGPASFSPDLKSTSASKSASENDNKDVKKAPKKVSPLRIFEKMAKNKVRKKTKDNRTFKEDLLNESFVPGSNSSYVMKQKSLKKDSRSINIGNISLEKKLSRLPVGEKKNISPKVSSSTAMSLQQSENLKIAQTRIKQLEKEIEKLREENENLLETGNSFKDRLDKITDQHETLKISHKEMRREFNEEKNILDQKIREQMKELNSKKIQDKDLKKRLSQNIQHISTRERELENRMELVNLEHQALSHKKDQYILGLKRQIDELKHHLENQTNTYHETDQKLRQFRDQSRKATQALRIAMNIFKQEEFFEEKENPEEN